MKISRYDIVTSRRVDIKKHDVDDADVDLLVRLVRRPDMEQSGSSAILQRRTGIASTGAAENDAAS